MAIFEVNRRIQSSILLLILAVVANCDQCQVQNCYKINIGDENGNNPVLNIRLSFEINIEIQNSTVTSVKATTSKCGTTTPANEVMDTTITAFDTNVPNLATDTITPVTSNILEIATKTTTITTTSSQSTTSTMAATTSTSTTTTRNTSPKITTSTTTATSTTATTTMSTRTTTTTAHECPKSWIRLGRRCFFVAYGECSFDFAKTVCSNYSNALLLNFRDFNQNEFDSFNTYFSETGYYWVNALTVGEDSSLKIQWLDNNSTLACDNRIVCYQMCSNDPDATLIYYSSYTDDYCIGNQAAVLGDNKVMCQMNL